MYAEYYAGYWYTSATTDADRSAFFSTNTPAIRRIETSQAINFPNTDSWSGLYNGGAGPATGSDANPDRFSARYRGELNIPATDTYTFYLTTDNAGYLWLDGDAQQQIPALASATIGVTNTGTDVASGALLLAAGYHDLLLFYGEETGGNSLVLKYTSSTVTTPTLVPSSWFCTGIRSVPTAVAYSPASQQAVFTVGASSGAPIVSNGNSAVTAYAIANASSLPSGITVDATTGVLTADGTVGPGDYVVSIAATNSLGTATFNSVFRFSVTAPGCNGIDAYNQASQPGLLAEYYANYYEYNNTSASSTDTLAFFTNNAAYPLHDSHNNARLQRVEPAPNYTADDTWLASGLSLVTAGIAQGSDAQPTLFSARYRGKIYISTPGDYVFYLRSDDSSYLMIDGSAVAQKLSAPFTINNSGGHVARTVTSAPITFSSIGWHDLVIVYGNIFNLSYLSLQYSGPGISQQVIPNSVLCTGILSVPTGLRYTPEVQSYVISGVATSTAPTVYTGNDAAVTYAIANASSLPAGITVEATTGVLTADGTVPVGTYMIDINATNSNGTALFPKLYTFTVQPVTCSGNDNTGSAAQSGLYGEYYNGYFGVPTGTEVDANLTFFTDTTPKLTANSPTLSFTDDASWSNNGLNLFTAGVAATSDAQPTAFSARYRGKIYVGTAGTYTFYLTSDDASYLFLDDAATASPLAVASATINSGGTHGAYTLSGTKDMTVGFHDVLVLYGQDQLDSYLQFEYAGPAGSGITQRTVPNTVLCSASVGQPLPVTLTRFEAVALAKTVVVNWATASEQNSAWFEVERSDDAVKFSKISQVKAAGTSGQAHQYQFLDQASLAGVSYYRLRQVDLDGTAHYSPVVAVQFSTSGAGAPTLTLAPNPTDGRVQVQFMQASAQTASLQVLDALGRQVYHQTLAAAAVQQQALDLRALPAGVYLVRVVSAAGVATQRLVRE